MDIIKFAKDHNAIIYSDKEFHLKSGKTSHWYFNWRPITNRVDLLDQLTNHLIEVIEKSGINPFSIVGVPHGATKLGLITQYKWALREDSLSPYVSMYRPPKKHGDLRYTDTIVGDTIVIEDVITTGGSVLEFLHKIKDANVVGVICLTDRGSPKRFRDFLNERNIWYHPLITMEDFHEFSNS